MFKSTAEPDEVDHRSSGCTNHYRANTSISRYHASLHRYEPRRVQATTRVLGGCVSRSFVTPALLSVLYCIVHTAHGPSVPVQPCTLLSTVTVAVEVSTWKACCASMQ